MSNKVLTSAVENNDKQHFASMNHPRGKKQTLSTQVKAKVVNDKPVEALEKITAYKTLVQGQGGGSSRNTPSAKSGQLKVNSTDN